MKRSVSIIISILTIVLTASTAPAQILFSDTFTGMDGSKPQYWQTLNAPAVGFWYLQSGQFATGNGDDIMGTYSYALINVPGAANWTDYQMQADVWMLQANGKIILVGRWQDVNNHYEGYVEAYEGKRVLTIEKVSGGNRIILAKAVHGAGGVTIPPIEKGKSPADSKRLVLSFKGSQISLSYAGSVSISAADDEFPRGTAGIGQWDNFLFFDNVLVENLGAPMPVQVMSPQAPPAQPMPEVAAAPTLSPPPEQAGATYRISIGKQLDEGIAQRLKKQLDGWGYSPVHLIQTAQGVDVLQGNYLSITEAERAKQFLTEEGLSPGDIVPVTGGAAKLAAGGGATVRKNFRVMVNEFSRDADAQNLKDQLEGDGYAGVDIIKDMNRYIVYVMQFASESEAKKLASVLTQDGYRASHVAEVAERAPITAPPMPSTPAATPAQPIIPESARAEWQQLTPAERERVVETVQLERVLRSGDALAQEVIDLKKRFEQLTEGQKQIVRLIREKTEEESRKQQQVARLFDQVGKAMDEQDWDRAETFLAQIRELDPFNPKIELKERVIKNLRQNILFEGQDQFVDSMRAKEISAAKTSAQELEQQGNLEAAIAKWESVKTVVDTKSTEYRNALENIGRLRGKINAQRRADDLRRSRQEYITYAIAGLLLVLILITIFLMLRSRRRDRELLRQVQELTMHPPLELAEGKTPLEIPELTTAKKRGRKKPAKPKADEAPPLPPEPAPMAETVLGEQAPEPILPPEPEAPVEVPSEEELTIDTVSLDQTEPEMPSIPLDKIEEQPVEETAPPEHEKVAPVEMEPDVLLEPTPSEGKMQEKEEEKEEPLYSSISLEGIDLGPTTPEETAGEGKSAGIDVDLGIDELLSAGIPGAREKAPDETQKVRKPEEKHPPLAEQPTPQAPVKEEPPIPEPAPVAKEISTQEQEEEVTAAGIVYEQDFDNEPLGKKPKNWTGDYEYATLAVSNESPAPGSKQHLKFEKKAGAGSAYYSCKFPDVTGELEINFDIRCDDKNKYLLGFYIEKDNDFRQSVHTIIHRTEAKAKPTLRIQGEPTPYELKTWRHVRYLINLRSGTVTGYVDDEIVADNVKLANPPRSLNSLSIRDNLATLGVLLVDNIKIVKK